jgi:hypothetical protein
MAAQSEEFAWGLNATEFVRFVGSLVMQMAQTTQEGAVPVLPNAQYCQVSHSSAKNYMTYNY